MRLRPFSLPLRDSRPRYRSGVDPSGLQAFLSGYSTAFGRVLLESFLGGILGCSWGIQ
jgi:hypothetical protein